MKLEIDTTDARQVVAAHEFFRSLLGITDTSAPAAAPASPPKAAATSAPAPTPAAVPAAASSPAPAGASAGAPSAPSSSTGEAVDLPTLTAAFQAFVKANGPKKMKEILEQFGAANIPAIPEDQRAAVLAKLQAAA